MRMTGRVMWPPPQGDARITLRIRLTIAHMPSQTREEALRLPPVRTVGSVARS